MHWKDEKGYSLLEALTTLVFSGFLMLSLSDFLVFQSNFWISQNLIAATQQQVGNAMKILTNDIQAIGFNNSGADLTLARSSSFAFKFDRDGNGSSDTITYNRDTSMKENPKLIRERQTTTVVGKKSTQVSSEQTLAEHVTLLTFRYFDHQGTEFTDLPLNGSDRAQVKLIKVELSTQIILPSGLKKEFLLESSIRLRN